MTMSPPSGLEVIAEVVAFAEKLVLECDLGECSKETLFGALASRFWTLASSPGEAASKSGIGAAARAALSAKAACSTLLASHVRTWKFPAVPKLLHREGKEKACEGCEEHDLKPRARRGRGYEDLLEAEGGEDGRQSLPSRPGREGWSCGEWRSYSVEEHLTSLVGSWPQRKEAPATISKDSATIPVPSKVVLRARVDAEGRATSVLLPGPEARLRDLRSLIGAALQWPEQRVERISFTKTLEDGTMIVLADAELATSAQGFYVRHLSRRTSARPAANRASLVALHRSLLKWLRAAKACEDQRLSPERLSELQSWIFPQYGFEATASGIEAFKAALDFYFPDAELLRLGDEISRATGMPLDFFDLSCSEP